MLVRFAIEVEAINDSATPSQIDRLLDRWQRYGILVSPRRGDAGLVEAIEALTGAPRKCWKAAWGKIVKNNGQMFRWDQSDGVGVSWRDIDHADGLAVFGGKFDVAVLAESRARALEIPNGEARYCGMVEGVRLWDVDVSDRFRFAEEVGSAPIARGESIADVWTTRFQGLSYWSKEVTIVDQYAMRGNNTAGIYQLLRFVDRDTSGCHVTIYSSLGSTDSKGKSEARLRAELSYLTGGGVLSVRVRLFRAKDFRTYSHDRHIRFDRSVFRIGRGMRIFQFARVSESTDVGMVLLGPGRREQKETDLQRHGTVVHDYRVLPV